MAEKTSISWTDHTFNVAHGCTKVSPGCQHCYAETLALSYGNNVWGPSAPRRTFGAGYWAEPLKWNAKAAKEGRRHRVFCGSMCDVFEDHATIDAEREKLWPLILATPWLDYQLLTKRAERIEECLPPDWGTGYPNVWLGTSIENDEYAWRAEELFRLPAAVRFVSYEPALGPLDLRPWLRDISWVIVGGESGPNFRQMDLQWARDMRDRCREAGVAFFFKQSAGRFSGRGTTLDGETIQEFPK
jgi:protein gp37